MAAYFAIKSYCTYTTNLFFREVSVINEENVPETGPTIVYSNHNNQFVDGLVSSHPILAPHRQHQEENQLCYCC